MFKIFLCLGMQIKRNVEKNRRNYLTVSSLVTIVLISFFSPINAYGEFENLHDNDLYQRPQRYKNSIFIFTSLKYQKLRNQLKLISIFAGFNFLTAEEPF